MLKETARWGRVLTVGIGSVFLLNGTLAYLSGSSLTSPEVFGRAIAAITMAAIFRVLGSPAGIRAVRPILITGTVIGFSAFAAVCVRSGGVVSTFASGGTLGYSTALLLPSVRREMSALSTAFILALIVGSLAHAKPMGEVFVAATYQIGALLVFVYGGLLTHRSRLEAYRATARLETASRSLRRFLAQPVVNHLLAEDSGDANPVSRDRRELTVLFADMVSFTPFAEGLSPDELADLLDEYLGVLTKEAVAHGGTIDKFVGDAVVVIFGAPDPSEPHEHAAAGVRAALAMCEAITNLDRSWRERGVESGVAIRIGVNTGVCAVGIYGSEALHSYTAIGRAANVAARLQARAPVNGVLVGPHTWELLQGRFSGDVRRALELKGLSKPLDAWVIERPDLSMITGIDHAVVVDGELENASGRMQV
ncbi:MAG: adenylate/guanylate cyclase domain-containing protein [Myxococcales bacterium]|nr:adenylate/guanylate cyclase domain-containing protein [Myxococcales bacterium]